MKRAVEAKIINPLLGSKIPIPTYTTAGAAGMDIRACIQEKVVIEPSETCIIPSGFAISIHDPGLMAVLAPRSGLGIKHGIVLANLIGVIDSDYHGEIKVGLWNRGKEPFIVEPGDRICQMLFVPVVQVDLELVEEFSNASARGAGGLGHTGKK
ncbi:MAG: dUTP diphosphatase [Deltaproteobacteria bacterium]|nr:dUTP diphosphatase [Deltaproteobacteria bacterium]